MKKTTEEITAANREAWDEAAPYHREHPQYAALLAGFRRPGYSCLDEIMTARLRALGLAGKDVVQLCCNNGREILSIKNLGAGRCLGIDQSRAFLEQAAEFAAAGGIDCDFLQADVYRLPESLKARFDIAVVTIGVFGWMPDLERFFAVTAGLLRPGGCLLVYEDHPILNMFEEGEQPLPPRPAYSYFEAEPLGDDQGLDYFGGRRYRGKTNYWTCHRLSDVVMGCLRNGLTLEDFQEYAHSVGCWQVFEDQAAQLPLSYLLVARKAGSPN